MVTSRRWIPDRGDLIWLTFTPQAGREQAGRCPALVLSPAQLAPGGPVEGCILADHLKSVDWKERRAKLIGRARPETVTQVLNRIAPLLGF